MLYVTRSRSLPIAATLVLLFALFGTTAGVAQTTSIYPTKVYVGDNVITIKSTKGIESIRATPTRNVSVMIPTITGCPRQIDIRVRAATATESENVDLLIRYCDGSFGTESIQRENWTIRHERTGPVEVGRDTCLQCEIVTPTGKIVDSIVVQDHRFRVEMPAGAGPWSAPPSTLDRPSMNYTVCFRPDGAALIEQKILLYIRRDQPNGGLTQYVIEKPISAIGVDPLPPPDPPVLTRRDSIRMRDDSLPPVVDPTTFRTVLAPTAETLDKGDFFVGLFDVAGLLAGYGLTDNLTVMAGGAFVPSFIQQVSVASIGAKMRVHRHDAFEASVGAQVALSSSSESTIRLAAPYAVVSYGNRANRLSLGLGYSWKRHKQDDGLEYSRNAMIVTLGGDVTLSRGWKLAAETYVIESSGLAPVTMTARWFNERVAIDLGFIIDLKGATEVRSTGGLSGEIRDLRMVPLLSAIWRFNSAR